jgi:hypothetical protein
MKRTRVIRRIVGVTAVLGMLVATSHTAGARPDGTDGSRRAEFTASSPVGVGGDFGCDPTDPTRCAGTFRNVRTLSGDFSGTTYQVGSAVRAPDGTYLGQALVQFTGSVAGCGSGTLLIEEAGVLDPATGHSWGTWTITSGHGTGDLTELSGTLAADTRLSETTTGKVRCT